MRPLRRACSSERGSSGFERLDRKRLEQLCRYITRPVLSDERVELNAAGQMELKLETPWRDGTTHLVMNPLEFLRRITALVPMHLDLLRSPARATGFYRPTPGRDCRRGVEPGRSARPLDGA